MTAQRTERNAADERPIKQAWTPPTLQYVGSVGDVLQGGGGKFSPTADDTGDVRKPKGTG